MLHHDELPSLSSPFTVIKDIFQYFFSLTFCPKLRLFSFPSLSRLVPGSVHHTPACLTSPIFNSETRKTVQIQGVRCLPQARIPSTLSMGLEATLLFSSVNLVHLLCARQCSEGFQKSGDGQDMLPLVMCRIQQRSSITNITWVLGICFAPLLSFVVFTVLLRTGRSGGGSREGPGVRWWCGGFVQRTPRNKRTESQLHLSKINDR